MYPVFLDIWKEERFPKGWKEGVIVKIPKKGDYRNCNNWRGITLLVIISKVFTRIILDRVWKQEFGRNKQVSDLTGHVLTRSTH
jgi:hypothetical protein